MNTVLNSISNTKLHIEIMKFKLDGDEDLRILNWLTPIDYGPQQSDYIKRGQAGTGQWLLDSEKFQAYAILSRHPWSREDHPYIYCRGSSLFTAPKQPERRNCVHLLQLPAA
jgi:hypothetical protein